ncbi:MAG: response regulator [Gemmatimonadales bacterium]
MAGILIVDDDASIRSSLRRFLEPHGHDIAEAADGVEALDHLGKHRVDLAFVDLAMPNMNGMELLHHIKSDYAGTKVVVMSAFEDVIDLAERELSVVQSLYKPFTLEDVGAAVRAAIS